MRGVPDNHALDRLARGVTIDGRRTATAEVYLRRVYESESGPQGILSLIIHEGRNRQVRKMCDSIGHPVVQLQARPDWSDRRRPFEAGNVPRADAVGDHCAEEGRASARRQEQGPVRARHSGTQAKAGTKDRHATINSRESSRRCQRERTSDQKPTSAQASAALAARSTSAWVMSGVTSA